MLKGRLKTKTLEDRNLDAAVGAVANGKNFTDVLVVIFDNARF